MKFLVLLLFIALIWAPKMYVRLRQTRRGPITGKDVALAIRMALFVGLLGLVLLGAVILLPENPRVLFLLPLGAAAIVTIKIWKSSRARLRRESESDVDLERMKRIN